MKIKTIKEKIKNYFDNITDDQLRRDLEASNYEEYKNVGEPDYLFMSKECDEVMSKIGKKEGELEQW